MTFPSLGTFDTSSSGCECTTEENLVPSQVLECFGSVLIS